MIAARVLTGFGTGGIIFKNFKTADRINLELIGETCFKFQDAFPFFGPTQPLLLSQNKGSEQFPLEQLDGS